jgi:hypothetical protein
MRPFARFRSGYEAQATQTYKWLQYYGYSPQWGKAVKGTITILLPSRELKAAKAVMRSNPCGKRNRGGAKRAYTQLLHGGSRAKLIYKGQSQARRYAEVPFGSRGRVHQRRVGKFVRGGNPSRVQGRKVKGGRSITLKNMASVTIIRRRNGTVGIRGVKK